MNQPLESVSGPEFRQDSVTGRWVVIAADRADRPIEFNTPQIRKPDQICPFCPGNEESTPPKTLEIVDPATGKWQVRVVANLYPAFLSDLDLATSIVQIDEAGNAKIKPAVGLHEVVIESSRHVSRMTELSDSEVGFVFEAYQQIMQKLADDPRIAYGLLFKNCGVRAGISLEHTHSQLVALPTVPPEVDMELTGSRDKFLSQGKCVFCQMVRRSAGRIVEETGRHVVICPYASRFPFEMCILPKQHEEHFHSHDAMNELATLVRRSLTRLETKVPNASYNLVLHTSPFDSNRYDYYHWHLEIIPRIATVAGLEWGSGIHVNVVRPEQAAQDLSAIL